MDFNWKADDIDLYKSMRHFAEKELNNQVGQKEETWFSRTTWKKCADFDLFRTLLPEDAVHQGLGINLLTHAYMMEGLGYGCRDNGLLLSLGAHIYAVLVPLWKYGNTDQKSRLLSRMMSGEYIAAHAITEPQSGSDALAMETKAVRKDDHYILNGRKTFITNAPEADLFLVFATINKNLAFNGITGFLIEKDTPGLCIESPVGKMGMRSSPMADVVLDNCRVPVQNRLGREKEGRHIFSTGMLWERTLILAPFLGAMHRQLDECVEYVRTRRQFGKRLSSFQTIRNKIVDLKIKLESARMHLYRAAWMLDREEAEAAMYSSIAKLSTSDAAVHTFLEAVQIFGGYGYTKEFLMERQLRDSISTKLYSGTSEMQQNIIADCLGL